jgi:hypothetical protein
VRAEPRERLRELTADRSAAEHDEPAGQLAQVPDAVGRQRVGVRQPVDGRDDWS